MLLGGSLSLMRILQLPEIRLALEYPAIIDRMRDALIAYSPRRMRYAHADASRIAPRARAKST